jgi:transcriptional regulator with XRE-family HTH domain
MAAWHHLAMAKKAQKQFIREWRKFRELTQEQLAERMGIARSYVSHVEKGKRRYDQLFLEAAAEALGTTPASLIMRDPTQPGGIMELWDQIPVQDRERAAKVLEAFKKTG